VDTCRVLLPPSLPPSLSLSRACPVSGDASEIRTNVCKSVDPERCSQPLNAANHLVRATKAEVRFPRISSGIRGEPFSPLSEKTNIRSGRWKVTRLDQSAHARPPGAATAGRTEVLLLHDPFVPSYFPRDARALSRSRSRSLPPSLAPLILASRSCALFCTVSPLRRYPTYTGNHRLELRALLGL